MHQACTIPLLSTLKHTEAIHAAIERVSLSSNCQPVSLKGDGKTFVPKVYIEEHIFCFAVPVSHPLHLRSNETNEPTDKATLLPKLKSACIDGPGHKRSASIAWKRPNDSSSASRASTSPEKHCKRLCLTPVPSQRMSGCSKRNVGYVSRNGKQCHPAAAWVHFSSSLAAL